MDELGGVSKCVKLVIYKKTTRWEGPQPEWILCLFLELSPAVVFLLPESTSLKRDWAIERNAEQFYVES